MTCERFINSGLLARLKMTLSLAEMELVRIVQQQLNRGSKHIVLPGKLVNAASEATLTEVRRLCKLNAASIEVQM